MIQEGGEFAEVSKEAGITPLMTNVQCAPYRARLADFMDKLERQTGNWTNNDTIELDEIFERLRAIIEGDIAKIQGDDLSNYSILAFLRSKITEMTFKSQAVNKTVYDQLIKDEEAVELQQLDDYLKEVNSVIATNPLHPQTATTIARLYEDAYRARDILDQTMKALSLEPHNLTTLTADLKGLLRVAEKITLEGQVEENSSVKPLQRIYDVVRGMIRCADTKAVQEAVKIILELPGVTVHRIKERFGANYQYLGDCLLNISFEQDPNKHVCEIQIVHNKLMVARKGTTQSAVCRYLLFIRFLFLILVILNVSMWFVI